MIEIRDVQVEDAEGLIDVNIKTWQSTYKGIINDATLESLDFHRDARVQRYKNEFGSRMVDGEQMLGAVAMVKGQIVGFVTYGKARENPDNLDGLSEIYALFVLETYQSKQVGRKLVQYAVKKLVDSKKYNALIIWTLKDNPSRGFYKHLGGQNKYHKTIEIAGQTLDEVGYLFDDINKMT